MTSYVTMDNNIR